MTQASSLNTLNNGVQMPALGLGVYQSSPEETVNAVEKALGIGYRLIDTDAAYGNETQVGEGIRSSGIDRNEVFVTTKLWTTDYGFDQALRAFDASMSRLGLDYLDLYLLHWHVPSDFDATVASYRAAESLLSDGRVRAIGVCNHKPQHLSNLLARTDVIPAVNQVELHPYFTQKRYSRHRRHPWRRHPVMVTAGRSEHLPPSRPQSGQRRSPAPHCSRPIQQVR